MIKLIGLVVAGLLVPAGNSWADKLRITHSDDTHPLRVLIWMILLVGLGLPAFALANCEGTGPCYCYGAVCTNTPPPSNSSGGSSSGGGYTPQDQMLMQGAGILGNAIGEALRGNPEEDAKRQAAAALAAKQQRRVEEQRRAEALRQQELTKQRILGQLKGTEPSAALALKLGDSESGSDGHELKLKLGDADNQKPKSDAYNKGFQDASACYSQNAGPYCMGISADQQQACVTDYRAGFELGDKQRELAMQEAFQTGQQAGASGGLANGASDPRAEGACRTQWVEIYNRGYFQGKNTKAQR